MVRSLKIKLNTTIINFGNRIMKKIQSKRSRQGFRGDFERWVNDKLTKSSSKNSNKEQY